MGPSAGRGDHPNMATPATSTQGTATGGEMIMHVFRGDRSGGTEKTYRVPIITGMVVLDALHYIQKHYDTDLAIRWNCKAARCGSCSAEVNGRPRLTCKTRLDEFP